MKATRPDYPSKARIVIPGLAKRITKKCEKNTNTLFGRPSKTPSPKNGGHGGMDFVQIYRLVDCLNRGPAIRYGRLRRRRLVRYYPAFQIVRRVRQRTYPIS